MYRQLEVLCRLKRGVSVKPDLCLSCDSASKAKGYVLPPEQDKILWERSRIWGMEDQKFTIPVVVAVLIVAVSWPSILTPLLGFLKQLTEFFLEPLNYRLLQVITVVATLVATLFVLTAVLLLALSYLRNLSRGTLVLTTEALYYGGELLRLHLPLDQICRVSVQDKILRLTLPAGGLVRFWVGHTEACWLQNVLVAQGVPRGTRKQS